MVGGTHSTGSRGTGFRPEIQALRAIAITSVLVYHLWPKQLTGGYLGVDVFFVISGFLITSHLLRDSVDGRLSLPKFWARRIRRLLPASLTVLLLTAVAILVLVPQRLWEQFLGEIIASTFYVENWLLAVNSVDYLAATNGPSPTQHFWSLSAEEQFYIVWPVVIALALVGWRVARARSGATAAASPRRLLFIILSVVTAASFAYAIYATATDPEPAFFATTTRAWEFGAGSLLAFAATAERMSQRLRAALAWAGWVTIATCAFLFTGDTVHPGLLTVIPVAGALLVIWVGSSTLRWSPTPLAGTRPVQFVGDISYSLYLWHWPFIAIVPIVTGSELTLWQQFGILGISVALGYLSYRFIERPTLRIPLTVNGSPRRWIAGAAIAALVLTAVPAGGIAAEAAISARNAEIAHQFALENASCFGAASVETPELCAEQLDPNVPFVPTTADAPTDVDPRGVECGADRATIKLETCKYTGGDGSGLRVLLVGDSHAKQLLPLVYDFADKYNWKVTMALKGGCPFMDASRNNDPVLSAACGPWNDNVLALAEKRPFDLVVTSQRSGVAFQTTDGRTSNETAVAGVESTWRSVLDTGARILAVRDNPIPVADIQDCLERNAATDLSACDSKRDDSVLFDPQVQAAASIDSDRLFLADFTDLYCSDTTCPAIIGGVNVYRDDDGHLTTTFISTLVPIAMERIPSSFVQ